MTATGSKSPALTYEAFQKRKKRREAILPIPTDDDAAEGYRLAEQALNRVKSAFPRDDDAIAAAQKLLDEAEVEVRDSTVIFRLRALPREGDNSFAALRAEHPPTDADHDKVREFSGDPKAKARWRSQTFEPALIAATLVEPSITAEQAAGWALDWNDGEWNRLLAAALDVNQAATDVRGLTFS